MHAKIYTNIAKEAILNFITAMFLHAYSNIYRTIRIWKMLQGREKPTYP